MDGKEFKFGTVSIYNIGTFLSEALKNDGVEEKASLVIYLNEEEFKKVDEDLYYRNREDDEDKFVPSEGEIDINFENVNLMIKQK